MTTQVVYLNNDAYAIDVYPSAARTATPNIMEYHDVGETIGVVVVVDVTAIGPAPSVTFKIQGFDPLSGKTWDILTSAAIATVSTTVLKVYPSITPVTNAAVSDVIPLNFRIAATHGNTDSITYSVAAYPIPA